MKINILGTNYTVKKVKYEEDRNFEEESIDGYCDCQLKQIVYCDMCTYPGNENEEKESLILREKATLRHEIVHAYFSESGLAHSSAAFNVPWAKNEEMVDWIALQGEKIYRSWEKAGALERNKKIN